MTDIPLADMVYNPAPRRAASLVARKNSAPRRRPENEIDKETINYIRSLPRGYAHKVHGGKYGNVGEPDIDGCLEGRALKAEAKAGVKRPTSVQMEAMRRWAKAGALAWWFTDLRHTRDVLDHLREPDFVPDLTHPGCVCPRHREVS